MSKLTEQQTEVIQNLDPLSRDTRDKLWQAWDEVSSKNDEADFIEFFFNFLLNEDEEEIA